MQIGCNWGLSILSEISVRVRPVVSPEEKRTMILFSVAPADTNYPSSDKKRLTLSACGVINKRWQKWSHPKISEWPKKKTRPFISPTHVISPRVLATRRELVSPP